MLDYLDTIKAKPLYVRKQIAVVTTVLLASVIVTVWWGSWTAKAKADSEIAAKEKTPTEVVVGVYADLKNSMVSKWNETNGQIQYIAKDPALIAAVGVINSATTSVPIEQTTQANQ